MNYSHYRARLRWIRKIRRYKRSPWRPWQKIKMAKLKAWVTPTKKHFDSVVEEEASPVHTAVLSDEDFDSVGPETEGQVKRIVEKEDNSDNLSVDEDTKVIKNWRKRFAVALNRRKRRNRETNSSTEENSHWETRSARFSVSTETLRTRGDAVHGNCDQSTNISLMEFLAINEKDEVHPETVEFADIDATDSASVVSGFLAVSFDDGCAQLEIQPNSTGGSAETEDLSLNDILGEELLGVSYPHPASISPTVSTDSTTYKKSARGQPNWIVKKQGLPLPDHEKRDDEEDLFSRLTPTKVESSRSSWDDDQGGEHEIGWSFSQDDVSFTSVLGTDKKASWSYKFPGLCGNLDDVPYDERLSSFSESSSFSHARRARVSSYQHNI